MTYTCKLCDSRYRKENNISFQIPVLRKAWIEACKLQKFSNYPNKLLEIKICSAHFDTNSYVPHNTTDVPRLKSDAVRLEKLNKQQYNFTCKTEPESESLLNNQSSHKDLNIMNKIFMEMEEKDKLERKIQVIIPLISEQDIKSKSKPESELEPLSNNQYKDYEDLNIMNEEKVFTKMEERGKLDVRDKNTEQCRPLVIQTIGNVDNKKHTLPLTKKRRIWRPANVVQLTEEHFTTPKERTLHLSLIKRKFKEQKKTILNLKRQKYRFIKKVAVFSDILTGLKDKKLIKEDVAKTLIIHYNTIFQMKAFKKY